MYAYVYVVSYRNRWRARLTLEPAVDKWFWLNGGFGEGRRLNEEAADSIWLWKEALPLGAACRAIERWGARNGNSRWRKRYEDEGKGGAATKGQALELLYDCVVEALNERNDNSTEVARRTPGGRRKRELAQQSALRGEALAAQAELWGREEEGETRKFDRYSGGAQAGAGRSGTVQSPALVSVPGKRVYSEADLEELAAGALYAAEAMQGRALLRSEARDLLVGAGVPGAAAGWSCMLQLAALLGRVRLSGAVAAACGGRADGLWRRRPERRCKRCGSGEAHMNRTPCASCGRECAYCTACIGMGRSRECELLVTGRRIKEKDAAFASRIIPAPVEKRLAGWSLSPAQTAAAAKALRFVEERSAFSPWVKGIEKEQARSFLLWAVTGAGKTEMIFPLIQSVLLRGGRVLIATPRRDVVIELDPRIRRAFPAASVVTLYGGSTQRWENGDITLSTTHQLFRFHEGFELVIVDEIDAYPYHGDPLLHYAADKSCAPGGARILLSATPPSDLQRAARSGRLQHARVPVRYHRHPLPVPVLLIVPTVSQMLQQRKLPSKLMAALRQSLNREAQLFVFVQRIAQTEPMAALLRTALGHSAVAATSSQDEERASKVQRFRAREIRVLVTTTILERGVTIPRSDVYILDADGRLFDEASLVQMAGRAGRSADDPFGRVYYCSRERSRSQILAVRQIKAMNRIARKQGYLLPQPPKGGSIR